ncbi:hypothetical protein GCM10018980_66330 [Streptomyces capoamus]|uniref:Uncharacterized protein n=1 Tax=Streptomyces capoamus TaxID=68183 RepID=A0A919F1H4_9ACTN|nr:hypothetical protein GCM10010501_55450 [Streptomyces libani subsp. rufus]GHG71235.1 hypothetical protein GCM10018980_66330 [Streptomyces capoamus]
MATVDTKRVQLVCAWCKEEWTFLRPKGRRGPNPATNPDHPQCGVKRQNQNRAISRQRERQGIVYEAWNLRPPARAENLTVQEESARRDAVERPWWRSCSVTELNEGNHRHLWDEWRSDDKADVDSTVMYSNEEDRKTVERWFQDSRAAKTGDYLGQTAGRGQKLAVIGSARPWREASRPGALLCTRGPVERMEPFVMGA